MSNKIVFSESLRKELDTFCRQRHIRKLLIFGSRARGTARPESDLDVLVEFEPGYVPGFAFFTIQQELSQLLGRKVDLHTPNSLSHHIRPDVLAGAEVEYVKA